MKNQNLGILILRLTLGGLMLLHGVAKMQNGIDGIIGMFEKSGLPGFLAYPIYLGEVLAPLMLIVGFRTRIGALLDIATMLVAIFMAHSEDIFTLTKGGGWGIEFQALYLFGALALFFMGGGKFAVSTKNKWD